MKRILWVGALLALFAGRAAGASEPSGVEAEVRSLLDAQVAAWNRGDLEAFMETYWKSEKTAYLSSNGVVRGWEAVLARYKKAYPDRAAMGHLQFSGLELSVLSPDAVLVLGHWQLETEGPTPRGVFTLMVRKFPGGWRIILDHTSRSTPGSTGNPP